MRWPLLVFARALLGLGLVALLVFCVSRAPRGFALFSWAFFEHQLFLPALATLAACGSVLTLLGRVERYALRDAFWGVLTPIAVAVALLGNTQYAAWFAGFVALALALLQGPRLLRRSRRQGEARPRYWAFALGAWFGLLFVFATHAPHASTHPLSLEPARPDWLNGLEFRNDSAVDLSADGFHVWLERSRFRAERIGVEAGGRRLAIDPAFELSSYSKSGLWTVFDFHNEALPSWQVAAIDSRSVALRAETARLSTNVLLRIVADELTVRCVTHVRREVSVHLARALVLGMATPADGEALRVDGHPWNVGDSRATPPGAVESERGPVEFIGYRHGRLELLRATAHEKGPFTTLASLADQDPWLEGRGFRVQIQGFVRQASREPSPTAGYGVSQGVMEATDDDISVELAATAVGRGWNTVRIAPGTYELTVVVKKSLRVHEP